MTAVLISSSDIPNLTNHTECGFDKPVLVCSKTNDQTAFISVSCQQMGSLQNLLEVELSSIRTNRPRVNMKVQQ